MLSPLVFLIVPTSRRGLTVSVNTKPASKRQRPQVFPRVRNGRLILYGALIAAGARAPNQLYSCGDKRCYRKSDDEIFDDDLATRWLEDQQVVDVRVPEVLQVRP